jgi:ribose transport system substrate-binding protein
MALATCPAGSNAQQGSPGITQRTVFPAFDPKTPACAPPPDLRRALTFVQENEREFLQGVDHGLSQAAKDRGLEYFKVVVENDAKAVEQLRLVRDSKVGALIGTSSDATAISQGLQEVIWSGPLSAP